MLRLVILVATLLALPACAQTTDASGTDPTAPSTHEMASTLRDIFMHQDWKTDPNKPSERVAYYRGVLKRPLDLPTEIAVRQALANDLLSAGDSAGAVSTLTTVLTAVTNRHATVAPETLRAVHAQLGLAYLRLGEQQNCLAHHATKSCIFPIDAGGMHHRPEGAEGAVREFTSVLDSDPNDTSARWLLNLAYMQLGRYPDAVPKAWLIPAALFRSEYALPTFDDVAGVAGVGITGHAGGAVLEDFDGDGLLDLAVTSSGPLDQMHLFHNRGDGTFEDITRKAGLIGEIGGLNLICADYDNDGHLDLVVLRGGWWAAHGAYPLSLLHNRGDGTFEDVTRKAGLFSPHPTQTAAFADFDNDGWLDLWVPHESMTGNTGPPSSGDQHPSQLFRNNHDGTFTDIAAASGLADLGFVKGTAWGDYNNDGRPDLYVSIKGAPNRLYRNDGPAPGDDPKHSTRWRFTDVTASAHVEQPIESFTTWFFDYDNDGWPDLFVAGYSSTPQEIGAFEAGLPSKAETPRLYHNEHNGTFRDVTHAAHLDRAILIMGASFGDLDNDGWLDVYLGTGDSLYTSLLPNRMFRNDAGRRFEDVTTAGGFGHLQKGHSIAFVDIDNDGDEDIFEEMGGALPGDSYQSVLYRNPGTSGTHSITLSLTGTRSNRSAFGAVVHVTVPGTHGVRHIYRTVGYGSSFGGNPLRQHIGVGAASGPVTVEVHWPASNTTQTFRNLAVDRGYSITEGVDTLQPMALKRFRLPDPAMPTSGMQEAGP